MDTFRDIVARIPSFYHIEVLNRAVSNSSGTAIFGAAAVASVVLGSLYHNVISYKLWSRVSFKRVPVEISPPEDSNQKIQLQLHYNFCESGHSDKPLIILVSGTGWSLDCWRYIQSELSTEFDTLSYDRMGISHSGFAGPFSGRNADHYALELSCLVKALNLEKRKLIVVGHSFGALVARLFAALYSSNYDIRRVILVDGVCEDMFQQNPELMVHFSARAANVVGGFLGRLGLLRLLNFTGVMWKMMVSHPGSDILKSNKVASSGLLEMAERLSWPQGTATMLLEIACMDSGVQILHTKARVDVLPPGGRFVSIVAEHSVGMLVPPQPKLFPTWFECQKKLTAALNGVPVDQLTDRDIVLVKDTHHASILASKEALETIRKASNEY